MTTMEHETMQSFGSSADGPSNTSRRDHGLAIIIGSCMSVLLMLRHPSVHSHDVPGFMAEVAEVRTVNALVHGGMMVAMGFVFVGCIGLADTLGSKRMLVRAALVSQAFGLLALIGAATVNGFVVPSLARSYVGEQGAALDTLGPLLRVCLHSNQVLAQIGTVGISLAVLLWSIVIVQTPGTAQLLAWFGIVIGVGTIAAVSTGHLQLHLHGMLLVVVAQAVWSILIGAWMMRTHSAEPVRGPVG